MDYKNNECLGCGDIVEAFFCPKCGPEPGKAFNVTTSVAVQVLPTPAINRFQCAALDDYEDGDQIALQVLEFLSGNSRKVIKKLLCRYKHVDSAKSLGLLFEENYIVEHIVKPVRQAYVNYLLGNWIACITTCGIACECLTVLIWRMNQVEAAVTINGIVNTPTTNALIQDFNDLSQKRRIDVLESASLISEQQKKDLHKIREWRNDYVHYSKTIQNETQSKAAREVFNLTVKLLEDFVIIRVISGKVQLSPLLSNYIEKVSSSDSQA
jgi:hypothetical protein